MFRQRTSSAKPGDDLLATFREQFPHVGVSDPSATSAAAPVSTVAAPNPGVLAGASDDSRTQAIPHEGFRDQDPTPRASGNDLFKFTPSLMDTNSFSFSAFANAPPGYYTPTPGGTNTLYHPQAGDLHTPSLGLGMGLGTPLSMPTSEGAMHSATAMVDMTGFHHGIHPQQFHHFSAFVQPPQPQQAFAPSSFVHQDTGYETMDQDGSPMDSDAADDRMAAIDSTFQSQAPMVGYQPSRQFSMTLNAGLPASAEKFRFHSTLNAPTAMIKHADEIPVTYLNKGQAYSLSIIDTNPTIPIAPGTRLRTFVRVSFEDEQQRLKPDVCWSLWKEGRGTSEAHQRGGKLQAVEYVEAGQPPEGDDKRTRIELESSSFDGFSVIWTPGVNGGGGVECTIAVRFNFLSTDFSHSKGVKGIPVRFCAKTTVLSDGGGSTTTLQSSSSSASPDPPAASSEICYCKVKLFRDHGAERKLSNDVAHVKKTIDKLKQQISQAESGMKDFKRKRGAGGGSGSSATKASDATRPGKVQKHKRTWSMSSASSAGGSGAQRVPLEEDLHFKLQTLQDMFTSTRPVSILYLRGEEGDDPDLHPVSLPGEQHPSTSLESREGPAWQQARSGRSSVAGSSSLVSPSPSSLSLHSSSAAGPNAHWQDFDEAPPAGAAATRQCSSEQQQQQQQQQQQGPTKVDRTDEAGNLSGWIEALGVDALYRPPLERSAKPVACFYLQLLRKNNNYESNNNKEQSSYYRAIYLMRRTLKEFVARVAAKWGLDESRVVRVVHCLQKGRIEVEMDDDVIAELSEGQDMTLEIREVQLPLEAPAPPTVKREWEMSVDDVVVDVDVDVDGPEQQQQKQAGYELRLTF